MVVCTEDEYGDFEEGNEGSLYEQEWGYLCSYVLKNYDFNKENWGV